MQPGLGGRVRPTSVTELPISTTTLWTDSCVNGPVAFSSRPRARAISSCRPRSIPGFASFMPVRDAGIMDAMPDMRFAVLSWSAYPGLAARREKGGFVVRLSGAGGQMEPSEPGLGAIDAGVQLTLVRRYACKLLLAQVVYPESNPECGVTLVGVSNHRGSGPSAIRRWASLRAQKRVRYGVL